jgi:hypothetical protein
MTPQEISQAFKDTFSTRAGQITLDRIKFFCRGNVQQNLADTESVNQTYYNCGAHAVYRYIEHQITLNWGQQTNDCIMESGE